MRTSSAAETGARMRRVSTQRPVSPSKLARTCSMSRAALPAPSAGSSDDPVTGSDRRDREGESQCDREDREDAQAATQPTPRGRPPTRSRRSPQPLHPGMGTLWTRACAASALVHARLSRAHDEATDRRSRRQPTIGGTHGSPGGELELGPIDIVVIAYPAGAPMTGEAAPLLIDLVERGIIRVLDACS